MKKNPFFLIDPTFILPGVVVFAILVLIGAASCASEKAQYYMYDYETGDYTWTNGITTPHYTVDTTLFVQVVDENQIILSQKSAKHGMWGKDEVKIIDGPKSFRFIDENGIGMACLAYQLQDSSWIAHTYNGGRTVLSRNDNVKKLPDEVRGSTTGMTLIYYK